MTAFTVEAILDAKGRVTIPAATRSRLGLEAGDTVTLAVAPQSVDRIAVDSPETAQDILDDYDAIESFRYVDGVLEVVQDA